MVRVSDRAGQAFFDNKGAVKVCPAMCDGIIPHGHTAVRPGLPLLGCVFCSGFVFEVTALSPPLRRRLQVHKLSQGEAQKWETDAAALASSFLTKFAIDVGRVDLVVRRARCDV